MNINQLNYLNIGLMFLSAIFAFMWPFETFLFVYAFLGPLHYLTEIAWLHERNYYTQQKYDYLYLIGATALLTVANLELIPGLPKASGEWVALAAFGMALGFVIFKTTSARVGTMAIMVLACLFAGSAPWLILTFGVFMPTLIHVSIFMIFFMSGFLALAVFVFLSVGFFLFHPAHPGYEASSYVANNYGVVKDDGNLSSPFLAVNFFFAKIFHFEGFDLSSHSAPEYAKVVNQYLYHHPMGLALMAFIAFSYTYHYLNWFSKTSIIKWHEVQKGHLILVVILWGASVALYLINYELGLRWLFFLSLAHVLLEFPLNHLSVIQIGKELGCLGKTKSSTSRTA